jgi:ligand-binding sensor domain-containing protein
MTKLILTLFLLSLFSDTQNAGKGIVYFSFDYGKTWENTSKGLPAELFLSDMTAGPDFLGVATKQKGIFIFDFPTNEWRGVNTNPLEKDEINALYFYQNKLFAGSKNNGIVVSSDNGNTWTSLNVGLNNLTIRKLIAIDNTLYAGTNAGLYVYDGATKKWKLEYNQNTQVNGIKEFDGEIYIGTNKGAFKKRKGETEWKQVLANHSLHNISADSKNVYALTYSELFISADKGKTWRSDQLGLPAGLYSFQIIEKNNHVLAGQWDGVYERTHGAGWKLSNKGMPPKFPVLELVIVDEIIVAASSQWITE